MAPKFEKRIITAIILMSKPLRSQCPHLSGLIFSLQLVYYIIWEASICIIRLKIPQSKFYQCWLALLLNGKKIIEAENGAAHNKGVRLINLERNERLQLNVFSKNVGTLMSDVSAFFDLMLFGRA